MGEAAMQVLEQTFLHDKAWRWGPGPWQDEPDKVQWPDEATGLPCLIVRNHIGTLCGYVGVAEGHPLFEKDYDEPDIEVHGGLSYSAFCDEYENICHKVEPGENDRVWWFGFDCGHTWDIVPAMANRERVLGWDPIIIPDSVYRDIAFVKVECRSLAAQLAAYPPASPPL